MGNPPVLEVGDDGIGCCYCTGGRFLCCRCGLTSVLLSCLRPCAGRLRYLCPVRTGREDAVGLPVLLDATSSLAIVGEVDIKRVVGNDGADGQDGAVVQTDRDLGTVYCVALACWQTQLIRERVRRIENDQIISRRIVARVLDANFGWPAVVAVSWEGVRWRHTWRLRRRANELHFVFAWASRRELAIQSGSRGGEW